MKINRLLICHTRILKEANMVEKNIERDHSIDILRGIAVILVCLLHVADKLCMNAKTTMLYNVIWSIRVSYLRC